MNLKHLKQSIDSLERQIQNDVDRLQALDRHIVNQCDRIARLREEYKTRTQGQDELDRRAQIVTRRRDLHKRLQIARDYLSAVGLDDSLRTQAARLAADCEIQLNRLRKRK